jgi:maltose/moltooligosaccharide transporter
LYGEEAAREAIRVSIKELKKERARNIDHRVVAGSPAQALLEVAGSDPANLIVVGNRGLGAAEGEALGSVPREVVKNAVCNVMVVQTGGDENETPGGTAIPPEAAKPKPRLRPAKTIRARKRTTAILSWGAG